MAGVKIVSTGLYHPDNVKENGWFIDYFQQQQIDISGLFGALGQERRFLINNGQENTFTMALAAAQQALDNAHLSADRLDLIVFTSQTPEYLIPTTALKLHHALRAGPQTLTYDMNANCAGLLISLEQVARRMSSSGRSYRALVVGSDYLGPHSHDAIVYQAAFADTAVAVILETSDAACGVIDSEFRINTAVIDNSLFPGRGLSQIHEQTANAGVQFTPFDDSVCVDAACESIQQILDRNNLTQRDIAHWFLSQFSLKNIKSICDKLQLIDASAPFMGHHYGYTATSSPFVPLHHYLSEGRLSRGSYLMLWTIGAGWQSAAVLFQV